MQTPVYTIAANAGVEGAVVVGKLLESDNPDLGYDAAKGLPMQPCCGFQSSCAIFCVDTKMYVSFVRTGEYVDMVKAGIIDPLKVIRTALVDAAR